MNSALLKFQFGPVQDFIAQARSTRDLWSGSYLLSWLVASGLNCLLQKGAEAGLDEAALKSCVVFPRLESQPLMQKWQPNLFPPPDEAYHNDELLTPNLTNLFLLQLPLESGEAAKMAHEIEQAIRHEWKTIATRCWSFGHDLVNDAEEARFNRQVASLLHIAWQVTPLVDEGAAEQMLKSLPLSKAMQETIATASGTDLAFPATLALNAWQLDAVRQVRDFSGCRDSNGHPGKHNEKDSLTGREEQIVGGRDWWNDKVKGRPVTVTSKDGKTREVQWEILFRERQAGEHFGAITFIKRVWHLAYLEPEHGLEAGHRAQWRGKQFPFPSTLHIASHDPAKNEDDLLEQLPEDAADSQKYFAVLTMDGDEIGKWMSGEIFPKPVSKDDLQEFSQCLSTFGLKCARPIVEACDGRLIYSGGDDVVALLPADTALECAGFLRAAFKGQTSFIIPLQLLASRLLKDHLSKTKKQGQAVGSKPHGYEVLQLAAEGKLFAEGAQAGQLILHPQGQAETFSLPGTIADVSAGIAIAHFKSPLQDVVREAQAAERRAKNPKGLNRSAVAITLMKRSGEITEWGCKWEQHGPEAYFAMLDALQNGIVSAKFPHRIIELVDRYQTDEPEKLGGTKPAAGFDQVVTEVLKSDIGTAAERQKGPNYSCEKVGNVQQAIGEYLGSIPGAARKVRALIGLCQTVAFAHRTAETDSPLVSSASSVVSTPPAERQTT